MSATKEAEELELLYGKFTDMFRFVMAANFSAAFTKFYNPTSPALGLGAIWNLHQRFEGQYQATSNKFYNAFRMNETGLVAPVEYTNNKLSYTTVATNYMIHGPQAIKRKEALLGKPWEEFTTFQQKESLSHVTKELIHAALEAPRQNLMDTMQNDPEVSRWIRKADSNACIFCKMLVSRGAVYLKDTARFRSHGNCGCSAVPVFKNYRIPEESLNAAKQFAEEQKMQENKLRKDRNNKYAIEEGLKEKKTVTGVDKNGYEYSRTTYVDTEKGKQAKQEDPVEAIKHLEKLKRDGQEYHKPKMTNQQREMALEERLSAKKALQAIKRKELDEQWAALNK